MTPCWRVPDDRRRRKLVVEGMAMSYMLLVVEPVEQRAARGDAEGKAAYAAMLQFTQELKSAGVLMASSSLASNATRLQVTAGSERFLDGPFAEAREMVGGFFLLNCATREEALHWAQRCPAAQWCPIEVRETGPCYL